MGLEEEGAGMGREEEGPGWGGPEGGGGAGGDGWYYGSGPPNVKNSWSIFNPEYTATMYFIAASIELMTRFLIMKIGLCNIWFGIFLKHAKPTMQKRNIWVPNSLSE